MDIEFAHHPDECALIPTAIIIHGVCGDPQCGEEHWMIRVTFLVWSIHFWL